MEIRGRDRRKENGLYHPVAGAAIAELGATSKILRNYRAAAAGSVAAVVCRPNIALCDLLLDYFIALCEIELSERDRVYFRRRPPMAQAYRNYACANRSQIEGVCESGVGDVKALKGTAGMRLRSGDWRVLFTIKANTITIHAVGHRRDIYD
jgi:mRNA interferase RelE/StbE